MDALLLSVAACMGIDIVDILKKGRAPLESLRLTVSGERAPAPPRRYVSIRMDFEARGAGPGWMAKVERAVRLSKEKYCSVLHSLAPDIDLSTSVRDAAAK